MKMDKYLREKRSWGNKLFKLMQLHIQPTNKNNDRYTDRQPRQVAQHRWRPPQGKFKMYKSNSTTGNGALNSGAIESQPGRAWGASLWGKRALRGGEHF